MLLLQTLAPVIPHGRQADAANRLVSGFEGIIRALAEAFYKTVNNGKCLMAQATTGIGKTIGKVFLLLKAMPAQRLDKLFYLAAKTPGRKLALDALALIKKSAAYLPLRTVELVARDKACEILTKLATAIMPVGQGIL